MGNKKTSVGRRDILKGATATAALMAAARASFPSGVFAQSTGPETDKVTLGFIALTDASPLIIAKEKKLFDKYGITDANVAKQASWGTTRDNMVLGSASGGNGIASRSSSAPPAPTGSGRYFRGCPASMITIAGSSLSRIH